MDSDLMLRIAATRERLFRCVEDELNDGDGHHKSYEGAMDITLSLPNIFERDKPGEWIITWHCYVVPESGRHFHWSGRTLAEAVAVMEAAAEKICFGYEMKRFERQYDMQCDEENEGAGPGQEEIYGPGKHDEFPA